jgi:hypothetical protein
MLINNIYKSNLDIIINWKEGQLIKKREYYNNIDTINTIDTSYILEIDGCYFNFLKNIVPDFNYIINIFSKSFSHHLILIGMSSNIENLDDDYNELNNEEYIENMINYLEQSLEGLYRFKEYNNKTFEYDKLEQLYNNSIYQLNKIKNKNIIHSFYKIKKLDVKKLKTYNNENDIFTEIEYEDIDFNNSNNNCRNILIYFSNILIRITDIIYRYTGFDITFGN